MEENKKNKKTGLVVSIILIIILVVALGASIYLLINSKTEIENKDIEISKLNNDVNTLTNQVEDYSKQLEEKSKEIEVNQAEQQEENTTKKESRTFSNDVYSFTMPAEIDGKYIIHETYDGPGEIGYTIYSIKNMNALSGGKVMTIDSYTDKSKYEGSDAYEVVAAKNGKTIIIRKPQDVQFYMNESDDSDILPKPNAKECQDEYNALKNVIDEIKASIKFN